MDTFLQIELAFFLMMIATIFGVLIFNTPLKNESGISQSMAAETVKIFFDRSNQAVFAIHMR